MTDNDTTVPGPLTTLDPEDRRFLLECGRRSEVGTNEVVLKQGQHNASLFIVEAGLLHVRAHAEGREILLGRLEPGGFFGDISLFDPGPTTAAVAAVAPSRLVEIQAESLQKFVDARPAAAAKLLAGLLRGVASRLRHTDDRLIEAIFWGGLLK